MVTYPIATGTAQVWQPVTCEPVTLQHSTWPTGWRAVKLEQSTEPHVLRPAGKLHIIHCFSVCFHIIQLISVHIPCILPCFNRSTCQVSDFEFPSPPLSIELPGRADKHRSSCSNLAPPPSRWTSGSHFFGEMSILKP